MKTTTRKSEEKTIHDQKTHDLLFQQYLKDLNQLIKKYPVTENAEFKELVNFKRNKELPIHRWFDYKQGYAEELVKKLLEISNPPKDSYILDPFNGVGTTQVVSQVFGYDSIGIDVNPIATFTAQVKTRIYKQSDIEKLESVLSSISKRYKKTKHIPKFQKLTSIFTPKQLDQILSIKGFWEALEDSLARDFFKLAYVSIIEDCSNRVKDGNGIKIAKNKKIISDVHGYYEKKCKQMISDLKEIKNLRSGKTKVIQGSLLKDAVYNQVKDKKIGAIIFSPPYANCFDYCEVYKMELWLGDFVKDYADFLKYRQLAIRSHVNSKFSPEVKNHIKSVDTIASLIGTYNIWNKHIPDMIRGYFDDMHLVLQRLYKVSQKGALCSIVVANSGYKGVVVPTDLLLAAIGESIGFKVEKILLARSIRASSQQMQELRSKSNLMRESIIILKK
ncbi:MAG TPA: DNA methyltransferase [Sphingobacterium sp.]|nr:DNA methyltransferase [Sphingobacterium sp.]